MSESPPATRESAGEGVAAKCVRVPGAVSVIHPPAAYASESAREGVAAKCVRVPWAVSVIHPPAAYASESAGEGVAAKCVRVPWAVSVTRSPTTYRIGWGGCGCKVCPAVARSCSSQNCYHTRIESTEEGVIEWRPGATNSSRFHRSLTTTRRRRSRRPRGRRRCSRRGRRRSSRAPAPARRR